jgi:hypothetical protein
MKTVRVFTTGSKPVVAAGLSDENAQYIETQIKKAWADDKKGSLTVNDEGRHYLFNINQITYLEIW